MVPVAESPAAGRERRLDAILILLGAALLLLDQIGDFPAIGARLQGLIDEIQGEVEK